MKKIKKFLSFLLATIILFEILPGQLSAVYANMQNPLATETTPSHRDPALRISNQPSGTDAYQIMLTWEHPVISTKPETNVNIQDRDVQHDATNYNIYFRNASTTRTYSTATASPTKGSGTEQSWTQSLPLSNGSLYGFKVRPYHTHQIKTTVNGVDRWEPIESTLDTTIPESEAIYLTDINVSASATGSNIDVIWDNPTWSDANSVGMEIFSGYRIYYALPGTALVENMASYTDVFMASTELKRVGTTLQYTIKDADIQSGKQYNIKIEPLTPDNQGKNIPLRDSARWSNTNPPVVVINNKRYSINFTDRVYGDSFYAKSSINADEVDSEYVRVWWDSFGPSDPIVKIVVQQSNRKIVDEATGEDRLVNPTTIGTIYNSNDPVLVGSADMINFVLAKRPNEVMYYQILIYLVGDTTEPSSYSEIDDYDPFYGDYQINKPNIADVKTPDNELEPVYLDIYWEAFLREPVRPSDTQNLNDEGKYLDQNVDYDIWVTDDRSNFEKSKFQPNIVQSVNAFSLPQTQLTSGTSLNILYNYKVNDYYTYLAESDSFEKRPLEDNKLYYIRIIAKRPDSTTGKENSEPAYWAEYVLIGNPITRPLMIARPPLRLKEAEEDSLTIQWDLKWYEAYDARDNTWHSIVGIDGDGNPVFGEAARDTKTYVELNNPAYTDMDEMKAKAEIWYKLGLSDPSLVPLRLMDLTGALYEIHAAEFNHVEANGGYETYMTSLNGVNAQWQTIAPTGGTAQHPEYIVKNTHAPAGGALKPDTSYVVYFRPYTIVKGRKIPYFPNYVFGKTSSPRDPIDIIPTVPALEEDGNGDTFLKVKWKYNDQLEYVLAYGELLTSYPDTGTVIEWVDIKENGQMGTEGVDPYFYYTVEGLFPDTPYYLWIWAVAKNESGDLTSAPSNPVYMKTLDIQAPAPPNGLSLASNENVNTYNKENTADYLPMNYEYIIVEWLLNSNDQAVAGSATGSGPAQGLSSAEWLSSPSLTATYMAKFAELTANQRYFFRAKTIFTVTKSGTEITKAYNYVVQISDTEDFTDYVEITIPTPGTTDPIYTKQKESEWTTIIGIVSGRSDKEYDGDKNPDQYPLPAQDFEFIYDSVTDTLTLRFRSNQVDANGNKDNNVDQRFISRLLQNRTYMYDVDLSKYNNKTVTNRVVELPYSIFAAFSEHKINLRLIADNLTITLPAEAVLTSEVKELSNLGYSSTIKISLAANPGGLPGLELQNESYASTPQKLALQVITPSRTVSLSNYGANISIDMKLSNRYLVIDKNVGTYQSTPNVPGWERMNASYDDVAGTMAFQTAKAGSYAVIARTAPFVTLMDGSYDAMYNVNSKLNIKDLIAYNPQALVEPLQFNNLAAAVARGSLDVYMNNPLSEKDTGALRNSNMLITSSYVSREAGISALIRLYELKTKRTIRSYSSLSATPYSDIAEATPAYQTALLKAGDLGFFGDSQTANPKTTMQLGDLLYMIDIIMQDAGM